jgi:hypothetical protein
MSGLGNLCSVLVKTELDQQCFVKLFSIEINEIPFSNSRTIQAYSKTDEDLASVGKSSSQSQPSSETLSCVADLRKTSVTSSQSSAVFFTLFNVLQTEWFAEH